MGVDMRAEQEPWRAELAVPVQLVWATIATHLATVHIKQALW